MRIDVNLATRPFVNRTPQLALVAALGIAAASLTTWNVASILRSRAAQHAVETQLREIAAEQKELETRRGIAESRLARADLKPLQIRAAAVNGVLAQKAVSWSLLLERLEQVLPWQAALRQIGTTVTPKGVKLTLTVRAKTYDDALELIDALERSPCFSDVYPHSDLNAQATKNDFEMTLEAEHDPRCGEGSGEVAGGKTRAGAAGRGRG